MTNYSYSDDDLGDRDDIALAHSKSEDQKRENYYAGSHRSLPTVELAPVSAALAAAILNSVRIAFEIGKQSQCVSFREEDWIGGDALDELLDSFPIDIQWENYGNRNLGSYQIVFSWDTDPETTIAW